MFKLIHVLGTAPRLSSLPNLPDSTGYVSIRTASCFVYLILWPAYKGDERDVLDALAQQVFTQIPGAPPLDGSRAVDGQKAFKVFKALPPKSDGQLELRKTVIGVYDKGKAGTVVEMSTSLVDKVSGEVYTTEIGSAFFVGQGGWGGPKGPKPTIYTPPKGKKPDRVHTIQTSKEAALLYR